jgi:hypothetical protein
VRGLKVEPEKQPAGLYDFLYRDSNRITSYYAQIFGGQLSSIETTAVERSSLEGGFKANAHVISGDRRTTSQTEIGDKRIVDPHDIITTDVLSYLQEGGRLNSDLAGAAHGSLIIAHGIILFVDKILGEVGSIAVESLIRQEQSKPHSKQDKAALAGQRGAQQFLAKVQIPSTFLLRTSDGTLISGTIKEAGMEEPISTYYFKHGTAGLADVHVICIKEIPSPSVLLPNTHLLGAGQIFAQHLSDMLFPSGSIRVTPIAIFRKLSEL